MLSWFLLSLVLCCPHTNSVQWNRDTKKHILLLCYFFYVSYSFRSSSSSCGPAEVCTVHWRHTEVRRIQDWWAARGLGGVHSEFLDELVHLRTYYNKNIWRFNEYSKPYTEAGLAGKQPIPGASQFLGAVPGGVLVPALSCPLLSTHQQCPVEPWH